VVKVNIGAGAGLVTLIPPTGSLNFTYGGL
jgi:hypothetical protein